MRAQARHPAEVDVEAFRERVDPLQLQTQEYQITNKKQMTLASEAHDG